MRNAFGTLILVNSTLNLSVASSLTTMSCNTYMTEFACRKDSIVARNGGASVAPEAVLLLSARSCRTRISALSTSMRARLKMFTDQSSVVAMLDSICL